jgi:hypothetical protein
MEGEGIVMNTMWEVDRTVNRGTVHWRNPLSQEKKDETHNTVVFPKTREIFQLKNHWLLEDSTPKTVIMKGEGRNGSELPSRQ